MPQPRYKLGEEMADQAWARVLSDRYHPGDGKILMDSLESVLRSVISGSSNPCALQEANGQRILAARLIRLADKAQEQDSDGSSGNSDPDPSTERRSAPGRARKRASRRRLAGSAG